MSIWESQDVYEKLQEYAQEGIVRAKREGMRIRDEDGTYSFLIDKLLHANKTYNESKGSYWGYMARGLNNSIKTYMSRHNATIEMSLNSELDSTNIDKDARTGAMSSKEPNKTALLKLVSRSGLLTKRELATVLLHMIDLDVPVEEILGVPTKVMNEYQLNAGRKMKVYAMKHDLDMGDFVVVDEGWDEGIDDNGV